MSPKMSPALLAQIAAGASLKTEKIESPIADIQISTITPNPHQPRMDYDPTELGALAESIRLHGLIQPIAVVRNDHGFTLVSGHSRLKAHKIIGRDTIRANIIEADDDDLAMLALIENVNRDDLHPLEIAIALSREPFTSMRDDHIAAALGYSTTKVRNIRATLRLSSEVLTHMKKNDIKIGLDIIVELQKIKQEDAQYHYYICYVNGDYTREHIRNVARSKIEPQRSKQPTPISRVGSGYKIDCSAIMDHLRESFESELAILLDKYSKSAGGSETK